MDKRDGDVKKPQEASDAAAVPGIEDAHDGDVMINVSGHKQELDRIFDPLSAVSLAVASGNVWPALAGSPYEFSKSISNGG